MLTILLKVVYMHYDFLIEFSHLVLVYMNELGIRKQ